MHVPKPLRFVTSRVFYVFVLGIVLIIIGQTNYLNYLLSDFIPVNDALNSIVKTIGATCIGSGVFTAVIKSSEYTEIFKNAVGEIIWSKKHIEIRNDKKEIWSTISRLMYDEKFPDISEELESIVTKHYFPVDHNFYITNYEFTINLNDHLMNSDYWEQMETINTTIKPQAANQQISYKLSGKVEIPGDESIDQLTKFETIKITVNGKNENLNPITSSISENILSHSYELCLRYAEEYKITIQRKKVVYKKSNPIKRFFASSITKNFKITVITDQRCSAKLYRMGTIAEFEKVLEQLNNGARISTWVYSGIILPHQGFMLHLK